MTSNKNLGNAGEFYVLAQLAQRGYIAGKTDDGQTLIDVIATDDETLRTVNIQVKATADYGKIPSWIMSKKNGEPRKDTDMRRFRPTAEELEKHKGNWEKMFEGA